MSTNEREVQSESYPGLLNANTIASSVLTDQQDRRSVPEDLRTRRVLYNPGFEIQMDPVISGLQQTLIQPGILHLFESGPVKRQNWSVDPEDPSPPDRTVEFQAGEGLNAVLYQNATGSDDKGAREVLPLRGLSNKQMVDIFYSVHPSLVEARKMRILAKCPYDLEVCLTCRRDLLAKLPSPGGEKQADTLAILKESVQAGRAYMAREFRIAVGEVAGTKAGTNKKMALGELTDGHLRWMMQLHEQSPDDRELMKIALQTEAQANVLEKAMSGLSDKFAAAMNRGNNDAAAAAELAVLKQQMEFMSLQIAELTGKAAEIPETKTEE